MKTAEEWIQENNPLLLVGGGTYNGILERYKQIQLDAMEEGMRRADKEQRQQLESTFRALGWNLEVLEVAQNANSKAILTTADQLTEKDLCPTRRHNSRLMS
jgi:hypothetical protein